jgi:transposase
MTRRAADGLTGFLDIVADRVAAADVAGFDETGLRVAGALHWVHCARTDKYTLITCPQRGQVGIDHAGVLSRFRGVAVHDAWAPHDTYADADHHSPVRTTRRCRRDRTTGCPVVLGHPSPNALVAMQHLVTDALSIDTIDTDALNRQIQLYHSAVQIGVSQTSLTACSTGRTTTSASPPTGECHPTTTAPNATYE